MCFVATRCCVIDVRKIYVPSYLAASVSTLHAVDGATSFSNQGNSLIVCWNPIIDRPNDSFLAARRHFFNCSFPRSLANPSPLRPADRLRNLQGISCYPFCLPGGSNYGQRRCASFSSRLYSVAKLNFLARIVSIIARNDGVTGVERTDGSE